MLNHHSKKFDAKLLSAKVIWQNSEDYELPLFKNSSYKAIIMDLKKSIVYFF